MLSLFLKNNNPLFVFLLPMFVFLFPFDTVKAQENRDYIITNRNDTIYGTVRDRKEGAFPKMYKKIRLKGNGIFARRYSSKQLTGYKKGDDFFESLWLKQERKTMKENYYSIPNRGKKVFMKVVVDGPVTLYHWEFVDPEFRNPDYLPLFKKAGDDFFVRATQGILGLKKKSLSKYFADCAELVVLINNKEVKKPSEVAEIYNTRCR